MFNRRDLLGGTAATATSITLASNSLSARSDNVTFGFSGKPAASLAETSQPMTINVFEFVRKMPRAVQNSVEEVVGVGSLDRFSVTLDSFVKDQFNETGPEGIEHDPFQIEYLIDSLADHILQCIDLRDEYYRLESLAERTIVELLYEGELSGIKLRMTELNASVDGRKLVDLLDPRYTRANGKLTGTEQSPYWQKMRDEERLEVRSRVTRNRLLRDSFRRPGSAMNLVQRYENVRSRLLLELREAFARARALEIGLNVVYGIDNDLPKTGDEDFLNVFARWVSEKSYQVERIAFRRQTSTHAIPASCCLLKGGYINSAAEFKDQKGDGVFEIDIRHDYFESLGFTNARLRSLRIASWGNKAHKPENFVVLSGILSVAPVAEYAFDDQEFLKRQKISIAPIMPMDRISQSQVVQNDLHNLKLDGSKWKLEVGKGGLTTGTVLNDAKMNNIIFLFEFTHGE